MRRKQCIHKPAFQKKYDDGFVMNGKRRFEKREVWSMARYIGGYVKHPTIAESTIIRLPTGMKIQRPK